MAQLRFEAALTGYWCACILEEEKKLDVGDSKITMRDIQALKYRAWQEMYNHLPVHYTRELNDFLSAQRITLSAK